MDLPGGKILIFFFKPHFYFTREICIGYSFFFNFIKKLFKNFSYVVSQV